MAGLRELRGRTAVVTGASSGIGETLAREVAGRGARVALVARRAERLEALAAAIAEGGGEALAVPCDVADPEAVAAAARAVAERFGGIDLLVNSAGFVRHVLFVDHDIADIAAMMQTNYLGTVYWTKAVLPGMRERGAGWIVNVSSFAGKVAQPDEAAYSATKFAVSGLSHALAYELAPLGVHVLCVHPVLVRTEMFTDDVIARMPKASLSRFIEPSAFAAEVLRALARGERDVFVPRSYRWIHRMGVLFPRLMGGIMARTKLAALDDVTR